MSNKPDPMEELTLAINETNRLLGKKQTFYRGIITGLATSLGATVVIALILWILSQLAYIPVIGTLITPITNLLQNLTSGSH